MQETWVWSLIQEDATCCGASRPLSYSSWSSHAYSLCSATRKVTAVRSLHTARSSPHLLHLEKVGTATKTRIQPKINNFLKILRDLIGTWHWWHFLILTKHVRYIQSLSPFFIWDWATKKWTSFPNATQFYINSSGALLQPGSNCRGCS